MSVRRAGEDSIKLRDGNMSMEGEIEDGEVERERGKRRDGRKRERKRERKRIKIIT